MLIILHQAWYLKLCEERRKSVEEGEDSAAILCQGPVTCDADVHLSCITVAVPSHRIVIFRHSG